MIPLTVPETGRLPGHLPPPGYAGHWLDCGAATKPGHTGTTSEHGWPRRVEIALPPY